MIEWRVDLVIQLVIEDLVSSSDYTNMFSSRCEDRPITLFVVGGAHAAHRLQCARAGAAAERSRWEFVRTYTLKNGHLFLALMADGGIYEFAPSGGSKSGSPQ